MSPPFILALMTFCFLLFGYLGVPVPFALLAGVFVGAAVATRRNDHLYLTALADALHGTPRLVVEIVTRLAVLAVASCLVWYGYLNYLRGFGSFRLPSMTPIASLYAAIPLAGTLIFLFTLEQLVNGWKHGFEGPEDKDDTREAVV